MKGTPLSSPEPYRVQHEGMEDFRPQPYLPLKSGQGPPIRLSWFGQSVFRATHRAAETCQPL